MGAGRLLPDVPLPWANYLFNLSNIALVLGAVFVLAGTIGTIWMGLVKEHYGDQRIAANETETALAKERTVLLEKETASASISLEKLRESNLLLERSIEAERAARAKIERAVSQRTLTPEQQESIIAYLRKHPASVPVITRRLNDSESAAFEWIISNTLSRAPVANIQSLIVGEPGASWQSGLYISSGAGDPIIRAFEQAGVEVKHSEGDSALDHVAIFVGLIPRPVFR